MRDRDPVQELTEENARLGRLLREWATSEYLDCEGEPIGAAEYAPDRHARTMDALNEAGL